MVSEVCYLTKRPLDLEFVEHHCEERLHVFLSVSRFHVEDLAIEVEEQILYVNEKAISIHRQDLHILPNRGQVYFVSR